MKNVPTFEDFLNLLDNVSRAYTSEIIDAVCSYFKIDIKKYFL
jgi:hypothetical protein